MKWLFLCCLGLAISQPLSGWAEDWFNAGLLFDRFDLTLDPGERTEALGPFFYQERRDTLRTLAIPPLFSSAIDPTVESHEYDFLYPLLTYDRYGDQYRWQLFQILSFAGGPSQTETERNRFTLFPFYFQQRSSDPDQDYTALLPFYGHVRNRLFRDEIFFITPFYARTRKKDVITENYFYPFFHLRHGDKLSGWQFWPFVGDEHKDVTTQTNGFGDVSVIGGHERFFLMWPFYHNEHNNLRTDNAEWMNGILPFYNLQRSPNRDMTTVIWPFFSRIEEREKKYIEWQMPWPLINITRGEGKTITRFLPIFSQAHDSVQVANSYLWPIYRYTRVHSDPLDRERTRILFFLYSDVNMKNTETGQSLHRTDLWPLFNYARAFNGNSRLQVLAPLEPILPINKNIERNLSPLWSVWRSEHNPQAGTSSQSLLWNLYRHEAGPSASKHSLLFGLFQHQTGPDCRPWRLFYIPLGARPSQDQPKSKQEFSGAFVSPEQNTPSIGAPDAQRTGATP